MDSHPAGSLPDEVYRSRVDVWLIGVIAAAVVIPVVFVVVPPPPAHNILLARIIVVATTVGISLLMGTFFHGTDYTLRKDELYVRSGPMRWSVPYREIHSVEWTNTLISSPALSLRRLRVRYGSNGWVVISPMDRDAFAAALARRVPGLQVKKQ